MKRKRQRWILVLQVVHLAVLGEPVMELAPFTVEAWHFDGVGMEIPASVTRLEREDVERSGAAGVGQLLEQAAGVRFRQFTGTGAEGQLALRGFGDNSGLRVLVLVDGQVYNPPDMGGINWLGLPLEELETVEVLRGGQTVLYGNHAVAGVVKLRTREPGGELAGHVAGEAGSDGTLRSSASLQQGREVIGLRGGADWMETDGYRDHSAVESRNLHLGWRLPEAGWSGRLTAGDAEIQFPGPLTFEQFRTDPRQSKNSGEDRVGSENWQATIAGEGEQRWGDWQVHGGLLERRRASDLEGRYGNNRQRQMTVSPRIRFGGNGGFLIAGADLAGDAVDYGDFLEAERTTRRAVAEIERLTAGGYLFASRELAKDLEVSGGIRLETARSSNSYIRLKEEQLRPVIETNRGTFPNPDYRENPEIDPAKSYDGDIDKSGWSAELSLMRKMTEGLHAWAGWDRVYRYPALDETASYQGFPLSNPLNDGLDPETGHNFEAGIKRFENNWHLAATVFHLRMDDEISFSEPAGLNINIGDTVRTGLEIDAAYRTDRYGISLHATLVEAEFRNKAGGSRLPLVPRYEGGITAWVRPANSLRLQVHGRYLSSQVQGNDFANALREIPPYAIVDASIRWTPHERLVVSGGVYNLLNRNHAASAYSGGFYPGAGRQGFLRLGFDF